MDSIPLKRCTKCGQEFPATAEYFRYRGNRQQFCSRCRTCERAVNKILAHERKAKDPEKYRQKGKEDQRRFRKNNKEKLKIKDRERRLRSHNANPEKERERGKRKYNKMMAENPQRLREKGIRNNARRRIRKLNNAIEPDFTSKDVELQFVSQKGLCWWCGEKLGKHFHVDHRIPLAKGGHNGARNICLACQRCNTSKGSKMPWEWAGRLL